MDQYYYEEGYIEASYYVYIAEAKIDLRPYIEEGYIDPSYYEYYGITSGLVGEGDILAEIEFEAALTSSFTQTAVGLRIQESAVTLTATTTVTATISHIEGADLFAFTEAAIAVTIDRIRDVNIALSTEFSAATEVTRIKSLEADADDVFTAIIDGLRSRSFASSQTAAFSLTADVEQRIGVIALVASAGSLTATARYATKGGVAAISGQFSVYTSPLFGSRRPYNLTILSPVDPVSTTVKKAGAASLQVRPNTYAMAPTGWNGGQTYDERSANEFNIQANENFCFEFWYYPVGSNAFNSDATYAGVGVYSNGLSNANHQNDAWWLGQDYNNGYLTVKYSTGSAMATLTSTTTVSRNTWTHLAFRRINGNTLQIVKNGAAITQTTYSGQIKTGGLYGRNTLILKNEYSAPSTGTDINRTSYFDEVSYRVGSGTILGYSSQPIQGDAATQVVLFHLNETINAANGFYQFRDDTGTIIDYSATITSAAGLRFNGGLRNLASADLTANTSVTAEGIKPILFAAGLEANATAAVDAVNIRQFASDISAVSTLSADVVRTRDVSSVQLAEFTQTADAVKAVEVSSSQSAETSLTATISHIHGADLIALSDAALSAAFDRTRSTSADLSAEGSAVTVIDDRVRDISSNLNSEFTQSTNADRTRDVDSDQTATVSVSAQGDATKPFNSDQSSEFAQTATVIKTAEAVIQTDSIASQLSAVAKIGDFLVTVESQFTQTAEAVITAEAQSTQTISTTETVEAVITASGEATLSIEAFIFTAQPGLIKQGEIVAQGGVGVSVTAVKVAEAQFDQTAEFSVSADINELSGLAAILVSAFDQTVDNQRIRDSAASANADTATAIDAVSTKSGSLTISSDAALTCTISHIHGADITANNFATLSVVAEAGKFANSVQTATVIVTASAEKTVSAISVQSANFALSTTGSKFTGYQSSAAAEFTTNATAVKTTSTSSNQTAATSLTATISHIESADIVADNFATITVSGRKIAGLQISATSAVNLTVTADKLRAFSSDLTLSTSLSTNISKITGGQAQVLAQSTIQTNATRILVLGANITSAMTFTAQVREIDIDVVNQYVYKIPREIWTYTIPEERWVWTIQEETRIYSIRRE